MEVEERHRMAEERHMEALKAAKEREEELHHQLAVVKAIVEKLGRAAASPVVGAQAFWAQPFSKEIDETTIPPNFCKVRQRPTELQTIPRNPTGDLATPFASQFAANKAKHLEAFQKGLRVGQFSDSLELRNPLSMEEIRTRAEKHIEVEEDQADRLEVRQSSSRNTRPENKYPSKPKDYPLTLTPLHEKRAQILRDIYHTHLLKYPKEAKGRRMGANKQEWCEFHKAYATKECRTLQEQIDKLIQEGHLSQYIWRGNKKAPINPKTAKKTGSAKLSPPLEAQAETRPMQGTQSGRSRWSSTSAIRATLGPAQLHVTT
ncbi:hypothetical protein CR513_20247, partial [Mucuna pruriens]